MTLQEFNDWVDQYLNFEKRPEKNIFWLDTMEYLCQQFENPQKEIPCFHVAGSKGKGSVSKMIACILEEYGKKTGIYSSPHILDFAERISTVNGFFPDSVYSSTADQLVNKIKSLPVKDMPGERPLTWFEIVTLYAMLCYKNAGCDYAVYEVGLGGRLDATNVVTPEVSAITRIELEHTEFLGDTVEKIAWEKGGIIKKNTPVIISCQIPSVKEVFKKIAAEKNAPVSFVDEKAEIYTELKNKLQYVEISSPLFSRTIKTSLKMLGNFQAENAALAALTVKTAIPDISEEIIERGLSKAFLPARFEIVEIRDKTKNLTTLVMDGAHTVNSIGFTMDTFNQLFKDRKRQLLFACALDKDVEHIAMLFNNQFDSISVTRPGETKSSDLPRLKKAFESAGLSCKLNPDYVTAINEALLNAQKENAVLLVTGSFYLVSEVKKILKELQK